MLKTCRRVVVSVIFRLPLGICFGFRTSDFGFETSAPRPTPFGGFPRLDDPLFPGLAPPKAEPLVSQASPFWRPNPPHTSVASPEPPRSLAVVPSIRIEGTTAR